MRPRQLLTMVAAVGLFTAISAAPVAAADNGTDDLIDIDGDDGLEVGVGGDDGVEAGVGTDDGVEAGAGGDEGVEVGAGPDEGVEASVAGEEVSDGAPDNVVPQVDEVGGTTSAAESDDLDATGDLQPGDGLNASEITGLRVCDLLRVSNSDLPTESLPGLDALPSEVAPSGVPTNLLTTDVIAGIVLGAVPGGCEVVDLENPQLDPTDPPSDPDQTVDVLRFEQVESGLTGTLYYYGTLNESADGPSVEAEPGWFVSPDTQDVRPRFVLNAERSEYGVEEPIVRRNEDNVRLRGVAVLVGSRGGADVECTELREFEGDFSEESLAGLGPCEYELVGIPVFVTPEQALELLTDATSDPPTDPGALPVNPDELPDL